MRPRMTPPSSRCASRRRSGSTCSTDGEQRREGFIFHMARTWDGIDLVNQAPKEIYRRRHQGRLVPRITGKIARRAPATVEDVRFAKAHTARPIKMALAGPMTVIDSALNEAYKDEAELAMDVAAAVNAELLDLAGRRLRHVPAR